MSSANGLVGTGFASRRLEAYFPGEIVQLFVVVNVFFVFWGFLGFISGGFVVFKFVFVFGWGELFSCCCFLFGFWGEGCLSVLLCFARRVLQFYLQK